MKKGLNGLIMVKNQLSHSAKQKVYHALISSHLNYCSLIWISNITKKQLNKLKIIQKKAIRIVYSAKYNAHTNTLFERSNVTKAEDIYEKESLLATYKFQNNTLPTAIIKLFNKSTNENNIITRQLTSCTLKPNRNLIGGQLMFDMITYWNKLDNTTRNEKTLKRFKKSIVSKLNKFTECNNPNCYTCTQTRNPSKQLTESQDIHV